MELQGTIIQVFDEENGISKNGNAWRMQPFLLETDGNYPKKAYIEVFGDEKIKNAHIVKGAHVNVGFDIESREFNGRWFTSVRAWKVEVEDKSGNGNVIKPDDKTFDASNDSDLIF